MTDTITTSSEATSRTQDDTLYVSLVNTSFLEIMYDAEKYLHAGYMVDEIRYPFHNFFIYEVHLKRNADTIRITGERRKAMEAGKAVQTLENKREAMAKARAAANKKKAEKDESDKEDSDADQV